MTQKMARKLMGKKRGMMQLFDDAGNVTVCTVIEAEPNVITQIKKKETDGYDAIQIGFDKIKVKDNRTLNNRCTQPLLGHFKKNNVQPCKHLTECRTDGKTEYSVGQELGVTQFADVKFVDVTAMSKGKGYQGVIKLHNFSGGPASHGSGFHRHAGSTGMRSTPGRCLPGGPRPSHMGYDRKTVQNLEVLRVVEEDNLIILAGSVPGPKNGLVYIAPAKKKS